MRSKLTAAVAVALLTSATSQSPKPELAALNPAIPPAIEAKYKGIRDAKDWLNPQITIRAEGVEVVTNAIPGGRRTVPPDGLRDLLIKLPVSAWPYGRVVLATDIGLRRVDHSDEEPIRRNHEAAEKLLEALD